MRDLISEGILFLRAKRLERIRQIRNISFKGCRSYLTVLLEIVGEMTFIAEPKFCSNLLHI